MTNICDDNKDVVVKGDKGKEIGHLHNYFIIIHRPISVQL